jgi:hypothetical protein
MRKAYETGYQLVKLALALVFPGVGDGGGAGRDMRLLHQPRSRLTRAVPGVTRQPRRIRQAAPGGHVPRESFLPVRERGSRGVGMGERFG